MLCCGRKPVAGRPRHPDSRNRFLTGWAGRDRWTGGDQALRPGDPGLSGPAPAPPPPPCPSSDARVTRLQSWGGHCLEWSGAAALPGRALSPALPASGEGYTGYRTVQSVQCSPARDALGSERGGVAGPRNRPRRPPAGRRPGRGRGRPGH